MNLCSIVPVNHADWMYEMPDVMLLTHLALKYPEYKELASKKSNYKILDNSVIELGEAFDISKVYKVAKEVGANEIILEDCYPDSTKTIEAIKRSLKWLKDNNRLGEFKLQAVCHGANEEEFKKTFDFINTCDEIDVIGLPKVLSTWCGERWKLYHIFKNTNKEIHFLGSWYNLKEIYSMPKEVWNKVRSCDTCLPSLYAIQSKHVWEDRDKTIDLEKDYPELTYDKYSRVLEEFENKVIDKQLGIQH